MAEVYQRYAPTSVASAAGATQAPPVEIVAEAAPVAENSAPIVSTAKTEAPEAVPAAELPQPAAVNEIPNERRSGTDRRGQSSRRHHRVSLRLPVRVRVDSTEMRFSEVSKTINVSRSGMLFKSERPFQNGISVFVAFPYDPDNPGPTIEKQGTVVRVASGDSEHKDVAIMFE
jgi:hypothetical protein